MNTDDIKLAVCRRAVDECIKDDMVIGLGTGSTVKFAIEYIAEKIEKEELKGIHVIPTSIETNLLCLEKQIPLLEEWDPLFSEVIIDVTLDGADKVTQEGFVIKGLGGAALREKVIAYNSYKLIILVDEFKLVESLSGFIPLEIVPFSYRFVERMLKEMDIDLKRRKASNGKDGVLISDNGNFIMDGYASFILEDPEKWEKKLKAIPGVVENGIFTHPNQTVYIGYQEGEIKKIDFESLKV